jgi:hypothetical protein
MDYSRIVKRSNRKCPALSLPKNQCVTACNRDETIAGIPDKANDTSFWPRQAIEQPTIVKWLFQNEFPTGRAFVTTFYTYPNADQVGPFP